MDLRLKCAEPPLKYVYGHKILLNCTLQHLKEFFCDFYFLADAKMNLEGKMEANDTPLTPLELAIEKGLHDIVQMLREYGKLHLPNIFPHITIIRNSEGP